MGNLPVQFQVGVLIILFVIGHLARRRGVLGPPHAGRMLQLVVYFGLPALFIADVSRIPLHAGMAALPASAILIMLVTLAASRLAGQRLHLARPQLGALILASMSINNALLFPFVIAGWGPQGFAQLALFDFGHALLQGSLVYVVAAVHGGHSAGFGSVLRRVASFPPLWALVVAIAMNLGGIHLPPLATTVLGTAGRLVLLLVVVALGILFDVKQLSSMAVRASLLLRIALGALLGMGCVLLFGLQGISRAVVLLASAAPIGFSAVVLASRESLDRDLAASAASISVLLGLVYVPLGLWLLAP